MSSSHRAERASEERFAMSRRCPKCDLENVSSAEYCDCGYDFRRRRGGGRSTKPSAAGSALRNVMVVVAETCAVIFALLGVAAFITRGRISPVAECLVMLPAMCIHDGYGQTRLTEQHHVGADSLTALGTALLYGGPVIAALVIALAGRWGVLHRSAPMHRGLAMLLRVVVVIVVGGGFGAACWVMRVVAMLRYAK
jgi:hypothetical protein